MKKIILSIGFNSLVRKCFFKIENPPVLPQQGEVFDCTWSDFIDHEETLKILSEYDEGGCWVADIVSKHFSKDKVVCHILLMEVEHYIEHQKWLRERGEL